MGKDKIIKKGGRASSHIRYTTSDGKRQPGGSSLARVVQFGSVDPLMRWAVRMHEEGIDFEQYRNEASDFGKSFHRAVECKFKGIAFDAENYPPIYTEPAKVMCENFFTKLASLGLVMVGSEVAVTSDVERWGGTMDLILAEHGQEHLQPAILGDLKSSNSIGTEHCVQVAGAYGLLFAEQYGAYPKRVILFRADRNSHQVTAYEIPRDICEASVKAVRLARQLWDLKPTITRRFA